MITTFMLCGVFVLSACDKADSGGADTAKAGGDKSTGDEPAGDEPAGDKPDGADADEAVADAYVAWCPHCKCEGDPIEASADKGQQKCKLTEASEIQGFKVKPSDLTFNAEGRMVTFNIEGETQIGAVKCGAGNVVGLFGDGSLDYCYTSEVVVIEGVPCNGVVSLRKDGELSRCQTGKDHQFGELEIPSGSWVSFWEGEGTRLDRFEVTKAVEIDGVQCKGYMNYLHEDGVKLRKCELYGDQKIAGKKVEGGTFVCFDTDGKLTDCSTLSFRMTG